MWEMKRCGKCDHSFNLKLSGVNQECVAGRGEGGISERRSFPPPLQENSDREKTRSYLLLDLLRPSSRHHDTDCNSAKTKTNAEILVQPLEGVGGIMLSLTKCFLYNILRQFQIKGVMRWRLPPVSSTQSPLMSASF